MSLESNKALVDRLNRAMMVDRNLDAVYQYFPSEFADHTMADGRSTPEMIQHSLSGYFEAFPDFTAEVQDMHGENDLVVTRMRLSGTHQAPFYGAPPTGKHFNVGAMQVYRVAGDKIVERWFWVDMMGLRQQLGLQ
jgi:steroid delta-isomerase-like uncharacterized protein